MIGYRFLPGAAEEMSEAAVFYEAASVGLGRDYLEDVQQVIDSLRTYPEIGAPVDGELRRVLLRRFPFSLIYSVEVDVILIVSVAHHRQRPGYWISRI
jgi:plasmid stabilization system protein ParE